MTGFHNIRSGPGEPLHQGGGVTPPPPLRSAIRDELRLRAKLAEALPFGEPGQRMLMDLALCRVEGRRCQITAACIASGRPATTGLRYVGLLIELGLARREIDPLDTRRGWISITDEGFDRVSSLFIPAVSLVRVA
jgi:hypothetical protein